MFGKASLGFLVCAFCIKFARSIELNLPLSEDDVPKFKITQRSALSMRLGVPVIHGIKYEPLENDFIRKVTYFGLTIFEDTSNEVPDFERTAEYGIFGDRIIISVTKRVGRHEIFEMLFPISEDAIRVLIHDHQIIENYIIENLESDSPTRTGLLGFMTNLFVKDKKIKKNNYDDLDTVDDEPYLLRGRVDISSEEIEKQVQEIIKEYSKPIDKDVAGPSGLSRNLNRKIQEDSDTDSDSD